MGVGFEILEARYWRVKAAIEVARREILARRLARFDAKAGYKPEQPREPAGHEHGGRWTLVPGYAADKEPDGRDKDERGPKDDAENEVTDGSSEDPKNRLHRRQHEVGRAVQQRLLDLFNRVRPVVSLFDGLETAWQLSKDGPAGWTYFDPPRSLEELQDAVRSER
jgi:hypothetical protein